MEKAVSTIGAKEQNTIAKRSGLVFMDYDPKTEIECAELYKNAPEIAKIAEATVRDGLQGKALLNAKKLICGDEWDKPKLSNKVSSKWIDFLNNVGCKKVNASYLLDFAGYKERGGEIETASHYREVKKIAEATNKEPEKIDETYQSLGGSDLKTAKSIKEAAEEMAGTEVIFYDDMYKEETGKTMPQGGHGILFVQDEVMKMLPDVNADAWKKFHRYAANIMHPDKGGSDEYISILNSFHAIMKFILKEKELKNEVADYEREFEKWKSDNGFKGYKMERGK